MRELFSAITVVLADDHELLRDGLVAMFKKIKEIKLLAEVSNGNELLQAVEKYSPEVVIADIRMPIMDGVEATKLIKEKFPKTRIIALSNYDEEDLISEMITAGADGYLLKNSTKKELLDAIRYVRTGRAYYCSSTSQKILTHIAGRQDRNAKKEIKFTRREIEVMKLICKGMTNKQIGVLLDISARTVESHRQSIQSKINVTSAVGIAIFASKHGIV